MPRAGDLVPRMLADLPVRRRAVTRFPYHVVYLETPTYRILAIAHDRRKPGYWQDACGNSLRDQLRFSLSYFVSPTSGISRGALPRARRRRLHAVLDRVL
jgi:hypothetical protein